MNKEILDRMPEWLIILRRAVEHQETMYLTKEHT